MSTSISPPTSLAKHEAFWFLLFSCSKLLKSSSTWATRSLSFFWNMSLNKSLS